MKKTFMERIYTAVEWLRCPSNRAIRRKIYFRIKQMNGGISLDAISKMADVIISRPRHERRTLLKAMSQDISIPYWRRDEVGKILSFLK